MTLFETKYNVGDKVYFNRRKEVCFNIHRSSEDILDGEIKGLTITSKSKWEHQADVYYFIVHNNKIYKVNELFIAGYK